MKIVILDHPFENPGEIDWSALDKYDVKRYDSTKPEEVVDRIKDAEVVFLNKTTLTSKDLESCPNLKLISIIVTGYNTVDITAARRLGIDVCNVPSYGSGAIAQHAFALLLEVTNHVAHHDSFSGASFTDICFQR